MKKYMTIAERNAMTAVKYWNTAEYIRLQQKCWELGFSVCYNGGDLSHNGFRVNYNSGGTECTAEYVQTPVAVFRTIKKMENSPRFNRVWRKYT